MGYIKKLHIKVKTYIITRFSILDNQSNSWRITRENKNIDDLKSILFDEKRLNEKFKAFVKITYESVVNQINQNFIWLIFISSYLPEKYKERIYKLNNNNIDIIEVKNMIEFNKIISEYEYVSEYTTVRLDDDDGLNYSFIDKLNYYYDNSVDKNEIYSLVNGRKININGDYMHVEKEIFTYKKIAIGLSKFNGNIYGCGNHTEIDKNYKVIYDNSENMFLIYSSVFCDTMRPFNQSNSIKIENIKNYLTT